MSALQELISESRSFDLLLTLLAYQAGLWAYQRSNSHPLMLPIWVGLVLVVGSNMLIGRDYADYAAGTVALKALLGPVIVALAVPLYMHFAPMREQAVRILLICFGTALVTGGLVATAVALLADGDPLMLGSLLPKAATTPIAMETAQQLGGIPAIAAVTVMLTGVVGGMFGPWLFQRLGVTNHAAMGLALGLSAHAVGTARAFEISQRCGAWSALGMGLMGVLLAVCLPLLGRL